VTANKLGSDRAPQIILRMEMPSIFTQIYRKTSWNLALFFSVVKSR